MKLFQKRELRQALEYAASGGQALHIHNVIANWNNAPKCFRKAIMKGESIAHLFDQDRKRLIETAHKFGLLRVYVQRKGEPGQHIDLCGGPLIRAEIYCEDPEAFERMYS